MIVIRLQKYDINVRPLPTRQISTSSRTPTSQENTEHQTTMETTVNSYTAVPLSEPPCFENGEKGGGKNECNETVLSIGENEVYTVEEYEEDKEVKEM